MSLQKEDRVLSGLFCAGLVRIDSAQPAWEHDPGREKAQPGAAELGRGHLEQSECNAVRLEVTCKEGAPRSANSLLLL